jgi:hypothetical protein
VNNLTVKCEKMIKTQILNEVICGNFIVNIVGKNIFVCQSGTGTTGW